MVKTLRKRPRPDQLKTQQRRATNGAGRTVYLLLLVGFAVALANYLFGDFVFLRADGLVLRDKTSVAATYVARVEAVEVKEGQSVGAGTALLRLQSTHMLERLADLSAGRARLAAKAAEFKVRSETVEKLLPLAEKRERESGRVLSQIDEMSSLRLVTAARYDAMLRSQFEARQALVRLTAESRALKDELAHFAACIGGEAEPPVTAAHARETLRILLAINKAIETGAPVALETFRPL